jgi:hypothetical protein
MSARAGVRHSADVLANVRIRLLGAERELELLTKRRASIVVILRWETWGIALELMEVGAFTSRGSLELLLRAQFG